MPPATGMIIFERFAEPQFRSLFGLGLGAELFYSFVIIVCSLMIYFGTKELYELSSYKGIKYFRQAFLFFAIAYFCRSFIKAMLAYFGSREILDVSPRIFSGLTLFVFMYFSSLAIFYLLYSVMWKKWNDDANKIYLFHFLAFAVSAVSISSRNPLVHLGINILLFIFVASIVYISYKDSRKKARGNNLYIIYLLLFVFWILNIADVLLPKFLEGMQLLIYLASSGIFLLILYRVIKKTGSN